MGETQLISDQTPLMLYDGDLSMGTSSGKLSSITLSTHMSTPGIESKEQLEVYIKLRKFTDAWELCKMLEHPDEWSKLGMAAISDLDVPFGKFGSPIFT